MEAQPVAGDLLVEAITVRVSDVGHVSGAAPRRIARAWVEAQGYAVQGTELLTHPTGYYVIRVTVR